MERKVGLLNLRRPAVMDRGHAVYDGVMADTDRLPTYGENVLTVDADPFRVVGQRLQGMV